MSFLQQFSESGMAEAAPLGRAAGPGNLNSPIPQALADKNKILSRCLITTSHTYTPFFKKSMFSFSWIKIY